MKSFLTASLRNGPYCRKVGVGGHPYQNFSETWWNEGKFEWTYENLWKWNLKRKFKNISKKFEKKIVEYLEKKNLNGTYQNFSDICEYKKMKLLKENKRIFGRNLKRKFKERNLKRETWNGNLKIEIWKWKFLKKEIWKKEIRKCKFEKGNLK